MYENLFDSQSEYSFDDEDIPITLKKLELLSSVDIFPNSPNSFDYLNYLIPNFIEGNSHIIQNNNPIDLFKEENIEFNKYSSEKRTEHKTQKSKNELNNFNFISQNKKFIIDNISFKYFSLDDIHDIVEKKGLSDIKNSVKKNKFIDILECKLCNKKRKRDNDKKKYNDLNENGKKENRIKRGRKGDRNIKGEVHNKMSSDNIIKKIKGKIIQYLVIFMNNILEKKEIDKNKIYNINYQYINQLKKCIDLELLEKTLKDILSMKITSKIKTLDENFNKIFIEKIENKQEKVKDYDTVMLTLNMKFKDFLSLFTFKKNIDDIIKENGWEEYAPKINFKKIEESLVDAEVLLNQIYKESDPQYLSTFIFLLFNYERWFYVKSARNNYLNNIKL